MAYGQRNPWRLTFRPGTSELWSGDVGGSIWEEVNRLDMSSFTAPVNRGWPCYEGVVHRRPEAARLGRAEQAHLREPVRRRGGDAGTVKAPYFSYRTRGGGLLTPGENCQQGTSSISGVAFVPSTSTYPAAYRGVAVLQRLRARLHLAAGQAGQRRPGPQLDHCPSSRPPRRRWRSRSDPAATSSTSTTASSTASRPAAPATSTGSSTRRSNQAPVAALYGQPDLGRGTAHGELQRGGLAPTPTATCSPTSGPSTATASSTTAAATKSKTYTARQRDRQRAGHRRGGGSDTDSADPGRQHRTHPHQRVASATLTWAVGQTINFAATATDAQQHAARRRYTWQPVDRALPGGVCHTHPVQTWVGRDPAASRAPDHEYPSHLLLSVTVTDSEGLTDTAAPNGLDPKSVGLTFASRRPGRR